MCPWISFCIRLVASCSPQSKSHVQFATTRRRSQCSCRITRCRGGTLIALAADEIVMCKHSVLGAVDPQFGEFPAASLIKVVEQKPVAEIDDKTLIMADVGRKAIVQVRAAAREFLECSLSPEQAEKLAETLSTGQWTHDYPISSAEAKQLGLPVNTDMPDEVMELMSRSQFAIRAAASNICRCRGRKSGAIAAGEKRRDLKCLRSSLALGAREAADGRRQVVCG
jgi:ClpP class serine protease